MMVNNDKNWCWCLIGENIYIYYNTSLFHNSNISVDEFCSLWVSNLRETWNLNGKNALKSILSSDECFRITFTSNISLHHMINCFLLLTFSLLVHYFYTNNNNNNDSNTCNTCNNNKLYLRVRIFSLQANRGHHKHKHRNKMLKIINIVV